MICPFCNNEMEKGIMSGDGRYTVRWKAGDKPADIGDTFSGIVKVEAVEYPILSGFRLETYFCKDCGKMIFDTTISE